MSSGTGQITHETLPPIPSALQTQHPPVAQMSNGRDITPISIVERYQQALEKRNALVAAVVDRLCQGILSEESKKFLRCRGNLRVLFPFTNVDDVYFFHGVVIPIKDLAVSIELRDELKNKITAAVNPINICFESRKLSPENPIHTVYSIQIDVSECRQKMLMAADGSASYGKICGFHTHEPVNNVQRTITEMETSYQSLVVQEAKAEHAINAIFHNEDENAPFNLFLAAVAKNEFIVPYKFNIAFNFSDLEMSERFAKQADSLKFVARATLTFQEIDIFFKKLQTQFSHLGKPECTFVSCGSEGDTDSKKRTIAEFTINPAAEASNKT